MAYTNLGTVTWDSKPNISVVFAYDYRRSGSDMQYRVKVTVNTLPTSISTFGYPIYVDISLDSVKKVSKHTIKNASPNYWTDPYVYETDWMTVGGKVTGTTALSVRLYSIYGSDAAGTGTRDETYSFNLTVSPAASIPTAEATSVDLGGSVRINTNRRDNTFYHRIGCKFGSYSHWGKSVFDDDIAQNWFLFSPPVSLASEIPNATSGTCTIYLATYSDAACTKQVGDTQSMTLTLTVPASVKPTVSTLMLTDEAGYFAKFDAYVQGYSHLQLKVNASQAYDSPIKSYTFIVDGKTTGTSSDEATVALPNSGTIPVVVRVTDGRGRVSDDYSTTVTVLPYEPPKITSFGVYRCQQNGDIDPTGNYVKIIFSGEVSRLNDLNLATWRIEQRDIDGEEWRNPNMVAAYPNQYSPLNSPAVFDSDDLDTDTDKQYVLRLMAIDLVSGDVPSLEVPLPAAYAYFRTNPELDGFSFGKEEVKHNTFGCAWDVELDGDVKIRGVLVVGGTVISGEGSESMTHMATKEWVNQSLLAYVPHGRKVAGKTLASDIQILMEDLSNWALVSDVTVSDVTYHTYWLIAPTADNDVYGWAIHPTSGKMYMIRNNKGTYTATDYSANTNTQMRSYRTSTDVELPLAALSTGTTTSAWAEPSAGSYKAAYGCVCNSTSKRATMNPSTGKMTFNNDVELKGAVSGTGFNNAVNALIDAKLAALNGNGVAY